MYALEICGVDVMFQKNLSRVAARPVGPPPNRGGLVSDELSLDCSKPETIEEMPIGALQMIPGRDADTSRGINAMARYESEDTNPRAAARVSRSSD